SIPSEDPYEEAAQQLFEQEPHSPEYVPRDHVPMFVPEFEHPEDLVPAEDEAHASLLPPGFLSPRTPPLLPIPLSTPSTSCRAGIPKADTPPRNRPLLATPRPRCEVGESSDAAARRPGPTMAHVVDCSYMETRLRDTERRMMAALELVNLRDRAAVRAEIEVLRSERLAYEQKGIQTHKALARSEAYCRALEARVTVDGSHSSYAENPRNMHTARPCYYADFMKCHPLNFKGTEGAVGLTCWIEKIESVFNISGCAVENQKKMTDKYCPLGEVKNLAIELWNLKVRDNDIPAYTNCFQELALICTKFVSNETEKVDKYISGLPDNIYGNVKSSKPKTLDETIELANDLMDQKLRTYTERKSDSKRKADDISRNNQQPFKKQNVAKAYNLGSAEKKTMREMRPSTPTEEQEWGNGNAQGWVYAVGNAERNGNAAGNPDSNVVMDLMPIELGSFDAIIGMDWLRRHHAVIVCDEKLVRVPFGNETLVFHRAECYIRRESRMTVKDVPIVQDFPEVFPEDLPGLPPARPVEFQIDLIPRAAPVA
nr:hypothetical protein [Tanacetum cinerariifolium]